MAGPFESVSLYFRRVLSLLWIKVVAQNVSSARKCPLLSGITKQYVQHNATGAVLMISMQNVT